MSAASIYAAAKKAGIQGSSGLFQDSKVDLVAGNSDNKENSLTWSTALSEQASSAKIQSPSIATLASRALSMSLPMTKGIVPLPPKYTVTSVAPSTLCQPQLVSTGANVVTASDGLITVTPLYTTDGHNVIIHSQGISSAPSLQPPSITSTAVITSMAASLLSAAYKPLTTNIPTIGQLLQSNQLFVQSQKTEQNTTL